MLGQWALGTNSIGQPEELSSAAPAPAECYVWITASDSTTVIVEITSVDQEIT
jgi:hypothetical protein